MVDVKLPAVEPGEQFLVGEESPSGLEDHPPKPAMKPPSSRP